MIQSKEKKSVMPPPRKTFSTYAEFWPFYLREHSRPLTRQFHIWGTIAALVVWAYLVFMGKYWFIPLVLLIGYGPAWISHFFIQKNRPATFKYPVWSFISDFRLLFYFFTRKLNREVEKACANKPN